MKTLSLISLLGLLLHQPLTTRAADDLAIALQQALFEEEANRDLPAAIQAYQAVLAQFDQQRKLAATAVFRLGECYRKMGQTNEAIAQYQRILSEFSEQAQLAQSSREQLARLGTGPEKPFLNSPITVSAEERETIFRLQKMVQESPDLINSGTRSSEGAPLHQAARKGQLQVTRFLLENNADVNVQTDNSRETPLHVAVRAGHKNMVELLLQHGAEVNARDHVRYTPLRIAAGFGFNAIIEVLLAHGADVNATAYDETTPLHAAAENGYLSVVETLLDQGAKLDAKNNKGRTPLLAAVAKGQLVGTELLLKHGASIQAADREGKTVLHLVFAASANRAQLMELLLSKGADVNAQDENGETPLHVAAQFGDPGLVRMILARKPNLELRDRRNGGTPLMQVVRGGDRGSSALDISKLLLEAGASPNVKWPHGTTLLHYAVDSARPELVELLLAHQANPNVTDYNGDTPLSTAKKWAESTDPRKSAVGREMAQLLLQHGADEDLYRQGLIMVRRGSWTEPVFRRDTNHYNNFTLFELLAEVYADEKMNKQLPFPDFDKIRIHSLASSRARQGPVPPVLGGFRLDTGDCELNGLLAWGDVVEIPEADHRINESWLGLSAEADQTLENCLQRKVQLTVGGETRELLLKPDSPLQFGRARSIAVRTAPGASQSSVTQLRQFRLKAVLNGSKMLRTSSDLSRVKVTRLDPATAQPVEMRFDLSGDTSYSSETDLWLRDGDSIQVP